MKNKNKNREILKKTSKRHNFIISTLINRKCSYKIIKMNYSDCYYYPFNYHITVMQMHTGVPSFLSFTKSSIIAFFFSHFFSLDTSSLLSLNILNYWLWLTDFSSLPILSMNAINSLAKY